MTEYRLDTEVEQFYEEEQPSGLAGVVTTKVLDAHLLTRRRVISVVLLLLAALTAAAIANALRMPPPQASAELWRWALLLIGTGLGGGVVSLISRNTKIHVR